MRQFDEQAAIDQYPNKYKSLKGELYNLLVHTWAADAQGNPVITITKPLSSTPAEFAKDTNIAKEFMKDVND